MTNHPNRNWRRKWQHNQQVQHFIHESGIVVDYHEGECILRQNRNELLDDITLDKARKLARLMKEANELWSEQNGTG